MMKNFRPRGFTLIEVLLYIALFGVLMGGAVVAAYELLQSGEHNEQNFVAQQEGAFINRKLAWALSPATGASVSGNILTISRPDLGAGSPLTFDGSGETLTLKRGNTSPVPLISGAAALSDVSMTVTAASGGLPASVHVSYSLAGKPFTYATYLRQ